MSCTTVKNSEMCFALLHSNANVERTLSVNKRMVTKQNMCMSNKSVIGIQYSGVDKTPTTLQLVKVVQNAYQMYVDHHGLGEAEK